MKLYNLLKTEVGGDTSFTMWPSSAQRPRSSCRQCIKSSRYLLWSNEPNFRVDHSLPTVTHKWLLQNAFSGDYKTGVQNIVESYTYRRTPETELRPILCTNVHNKARISRPTPRPNSAPFGLIKLGDQSINQSIMIFSVARIVNYY